MAERNRNIGVILEIGVGAYPFPTNPTMLKSHDGRKLGREFREGSMYIGIDCPPDPDRYWHNIMAFMRGGEDMEPLTQEQREVFHKNLANAQKYFSQDRPMESINFLVADAHYLPFKDGSMDEVFLSNVFGSQLSYHSLELILKNIERVVRPSGKIVIRETGTPQWSWREDMPDMLKKHGFSSVEFVGYGSHGYSELLNTYGATFEDVDRGFKLFQEDMYYCIASRE